VDLTGVRTRAALAVPALLVLAVLVACASFGCGASVHKTSALRRIQSISLPGVEGRIDHLAVDPADGRLFVAALENDTLEVVDLRSGRRVDQVRGLQEPQGVSYIPNTHRLIVTEGGGSSADIYDARSLKPVDRVELGPDPDNVHYDPATEQAYVGYGGGTDSALGVIDLKTNTKVTDIKLSGHPESFQLEKDGQRIFVNVPDSGAVEVAASIGFLVALSFAEIPWGIVGALLIGGVLAAPLAAYVVRLLPARILGTLVAGIILITNMKTFLETVGVSGSTATVIYLAITTVVVSALAFAIFVTRHDEQPQVVQEGDVA
jgi:DNA-binding beta-propeller fold protein YncE